MSNIIFIKIICDKKNYQQFYNLKRTVCGLFCCGLQETIYDQYFPQISISKINFLFTSFYTLLVIALILTYQVQTVNSKLSKVYSCSSPMKEENSTYPLLPIPYKKVQTMCVFLILFISQVYMLIQFIKVMWIILHIINTRLKRK